VQQVHLTGALFPAEAHYTPEKRLTRSKEAMLIPHGIQANQPIPVLAFTRLQLTWRMTHVYLLQYLYLMLDES
jgi:hypothetical protein